VAGGCNITQEFARVTKTAKIERMCDFYRRMTQEILLEQLREVTAQELELLQSATERGKCYAENKAETATTDSQGQGAAEAEGALHLSASQQLPLM